MMLANSPMELASRGGARKLRGVDYDFLDALLRKKKPATGRAVTMSKTVLERLRLAEPLRKLRYELKGWKAHLKIG